MHTKSVFHGSLGRRISFGSLRCVIPLALTPLVTSQLGAQESHYLRDITTLAESQAVQAAFQAIENLETRTLSDHIALTEIAAPPFMEAERAEAFAQLLREAGADSVALDDVGNVLAYRGGQTGTRTVVLGAHLDTVFPEGTDVTVRISGDTLFAPGVGDDTRGLMVVLTVLRALEAANIDTDANLIFLGTVGEEGLGDLKGVKHLFRSGGPRVDAYIEVDGSGSGTIVNQGLGSIRYRVTYRGPGGHSWGAFGLANPAHAMGRAVEAFSVVADSMTRSGPRTSFNVGRIGGGTSINSIPYEAWMEVDMRSESPSSLETISEAFLAAVDSGLAEENAARRDGPPLEVEVDQIGLRPSGEIDPDVALVQRAMAATQYFGAEPRLSRSSTNSNIPISLGIPAVTIGRGGAGSENHSLTEWWANIDGHLGIQKALLLILAEAGMAKGGG